MILLAALVAVSAAAQIPPGSIAAPETWVNDEFIAYVHGLVYGDHELETDGPTFRETFPEFNTERWTPFDELERIARVRTDHGATVVMEFEVPMEHSVAAVSILGWRPVRLLGSQRIVGREVHAGTTAGDHLLAPARMAGVDDLVVLELEDSYLRVDIADWIDHMLGPLVDDIDVKIVAAGRMEEIWYGIMGGINAQGVPRTGIYNLTTGAFELYPPEPLAGLAVELVELSME
jgi:hypothetical protein